MELEEITGNEGHGALTLHLPCRPGSQAASRSAVRGLGGLLSDSEVSDLELLVDEVVSNSIRHSAMDTAELIDIRIEVTRDVVRASVVDQGPGLLEESLRDSHGLGLKILDRLASQWGTDPEDPAHVWFELKRA